MIISATIWIVLLYPFFNTFSFGQDRAQAELSYRGGTVIIRADRLVRESANLWSAEGEVVLTYEDAVLRASRVTYNASSQEATLEGKVEVIRGVQWLKARRAKLNLGTNTGTLYEAEGYTDQELYIKAKKLVKTGPETYVAENGFLTACEESVPKWSFSIDTAKIQLQSTARLTHSLFRVKKVPIFYLPFVIFPTTKKERSSGFMLPTTGNSSNKGRRISQSFYLVLGRSSDLMLHEDYFSERGFGHGFTFRTRPNRSTSLQLDGFLVDDRKGQGGASLNAIGESQLGSGFRAVADFNLVSNFVFRQVFSDNFYTATRPTENSRFFLSNNFQSRSLNVVFSREETIFSERNVVIRHTPAFTFKLLGQRLFNAPIYLDLDTSAEGLSRADRLIETPGVTQRLDLFPRLYFSLPLFQGLRLTPGLGLRETFYSDSLSLPDGSQEQNPVSGNNIHRRYLEFTLDLKGWGLSKVYQSSTNRSWKHLVEPVMRYRYLTGINQFEQILRFDERDTIVDTHEIEYALINRFFVRRQTQKGVTGNSEWLSVKVAQKHFLDPDFGGASQPGAVNQFSTLSVFTGFPYGGIQRNFSPLTTVVRITPQPRYSFDIRADYDPTFGKVRSFSLSGFLHRDVFSLGTAYFLTQKLEPGSFESNQVQGFVQVGNSQRGLSLSGIFSFDAQTSRFLNSRTRINYFWDCCGVALEWEGFNVGLRQERQIRFSFFLKGIGAFGTIRRPNSTF